MGSRRPLLVGVKIRDRGVVCDEGCITEEIPTTWGIHFIGYLSGFVFSTYYLSINKMSDFPRPSPSELSSWNWTTTQGNYTRSIRNHLLSVSSYGYLVFGIGWNLRCSFSPLKLSLADYGMYRSLHRNIVPVPGIYAWDPGPNATGAEYTITT